MTSILRKYPSQASLISVYKKDVLFQDIFSSYFREVFEIISTPKGQQRPDAPDTMNLMDLLVHKDKEIKETLKTGTFVLCF